MPGFNIHLAVAKRWAEKHAGAVKDIRAFYDGSLAPDLTDDKCATHYTDRELTKIDLYHFFQNRIGLEQYKKENKTETDFDKGRLLHLITDHLFFTTFFDKAWLKTVWHEDFARNLYYSYGVTNPYLQEKYGVSLAMSSYEEKLHAVIKKDRKDKKLGEGGEVLIIDAVKLDEFIERVSDESLA